MKRRNFVKTSAAAVGLVGSIGDFAIARCNRKRISKNR